MKYLVAFDNSPHARKALTFATALLKPEDTLVLMSVLPEQSPHVGAPLEDDAHVANARKTMLEAARPVLSTEHVRIKHSRLCSNLDRD